MHAEYGGLVIYNLKLEKGCVSLPDMRFDDDNAPPYRLTQWQELVLMTHGISAQSMRRRPRWLPKEKEAKKQKLNSVNQLLISNIFLYLCGVIQRYRTLHQKQFQTSS